MSEQSKPEKSEANTSNDDPQNLKTRRDFLRSLGRWSAIIIGGAALGGMIAHPEDAAGWVNGRGGGGGAWVNGRGGGGGAWVNKAGGGGGAWVNGGGWVNRAGGAWINSRGGWINR
jgi:hypothetical protein